ncbi:MAG: Spy/CpxP family protein refolding chaperone [Rariglobus sp.]
MKSTRKYLLAVCALAIGFAAPTIRAEEGSAPPPGPKKEMRSPAERILGLKEKLGLTEAQVAQLKKIGEDHRAAMKALREKEGERDSKKEEVQKIMESTKAKVAAVLTTEQKAKLEALKKEHGEEKGPKDGKKAPPAE